MFDFFKNLLNFFKTFFPKFSLYLIKLCLLFINYWNLIRDIKFSLMYVILGFFKESEKHLHLIENISPRRKYLKMTIVHKIVVSKLTTSPRKFIQTKRTMQFWKLIDRREVGEKRRRFYFDVFVYDYVYFTVQ